MHSKFMSSPGAWMSLCWWCTADLSRVSPASHLIAAGFGSNPFLQPCVCWSGVDNEWAKIQVVHWYKKSCRLQCCHFQTGTWPHTNHRVCACRFSSCILYIHQCLNFYGNNTFLYLDHYCDKEHAKFRILMHRLNLIMGVWFQNDPLFYVTVIFV